MVLHFHIVPLAFTIVFWVIGKGFVKVDVVTDSMSRSGVASELAGGPVHYGVCITLATVFFWKRVECLYSILPIAFGDGFSAFFGPGIPGNRFLPWNPSKTWFGFASFVFFSWISLAFYNWMVLKWVRNCFLTVGKAASSIRMQTISQILCLCRYCAG